MRLVLPNMAFANVGDVSEVFTNEYIKNNHSQWISGLMPTNWSIEQAPQRRTWLLTGSRNSKDDHNRTFHNSFNL